MNGGRHKTLTEDEYIITHECGTYFFTTGRARRDTKNRAKHIRALPEMNEAYTHLLESGKARTQSVGRNLESRASSRQCGGRMAKANALYGDGTDDDAESDSGEKKSSSRMTTRKSEKRAESDD